MKYKKLIILSSMLLLLIFSFGIVAAHENNTEVISDAAVSNNGDYNAQIIVKNTSYEYRTYNGNEILFSLKDLDGNPITDANPKVTYDNKKIRAFHDSEDYFSQGAGTYVLDVDPNAGNHKIKIELNSSKYSAEPVLFNVNIIKTATKLTLSKYVTTTNEYAILKATVKDKYGYKIYEGKVKFKINGKTFTVNVKNGVATKKIKLNKAKTYTYTATFSSTNYKTKTASSKVYIKKTKKYYTLKIRNSNLNKNFKVKISYKQYLKILNAKNKGTYGYVDVDTGIKRPPEWGGGHYYVGLSTNDDYFTYYGYEKGDYVFLRASSYLEIKKVNLYTANF